MQPLKLQRVLGGNGLSLESGNPLSPECVGHCLTRGVEQCDVACGKDNA